MSHELDGKRVLVAGLGDSGLAMARWCAQHGASVLVADTREAPPRLSALRAAAPAARFVGGGLEPALLDGVDLVAWSPGLSPFAGAAQALHAAARERGVPVHGELEFFAREIARLRAAGRTTRIVAVTGTNGKTTTTRLVGHLCRQAGLRVAVAGNIGPAALDALADCLAHDDVPEVWVLELSSFQLATTDSFAADCATILNLTQDHLDWHLSFDAYVDAKQRIYAPSTIRVYNRDDAATRPRPPAPAPLVLGRGGKPIKRQPPPPVAAPRIGFGLGEPDAAPGFGIVREGSLNWLVEAVADEDGGLRLKRLMPADALRIRGAHNHANALAALALCRAIGVPMASMLHALRGFEGEPHRCQLVGVVRDIEYYDDSKGTNVGATVAALEGLGKRCVLIAGGDGKGQDFAPLVEPVRRNALAVMLIGRDAPRLREALAPAGVTLIDCDGLEQAVERAAAIATLGDAVLLSPACASLDMFRNYRHRGEVFAESVRRLAIDAGQPC